MSSFKPLLAAPVDFSKLDYSNLWASRKLDGIRAIVINSVVMSRKLLPIPNDEVQRMFGRPEFNGFDGELIVGPPNSPTVYLDTYSGVMKKTGKPEVSFYAFDHVGDPNLEYFRRYEMLSTRPGPFGDCVVKLDQFPVGNLFDLDHLEQVFLDEGYEGIMVRAFQGPASRYKFGRSTAGQGTLLKLKRMQSDEAEIVGFQEEMFNGNEATTDELGRTKRSSHQENKIGKDRLGAFICRTPAGVEFNVGTGLTAKQRQDYWGQQDQLLGQLVTYNHFPIGVVDAPRFPSFKGFRSKIDV